MNYNDEPEMYKKGSVVFREYAPETLSDMGEGLSAGKAKSFAENEEDEEPSAVPETFSKTQMEKQRRARRKAKVVTMHVDIIRDEFWLERPWLRSGKAGRSIEDAGEG